MIARKERDGLSSTRSDLGALAVFNRIGGGIKIARDRVGLTGAALARRAGIGKSQLSKYENGKELPRFESLARVLDALEIDPLTFFCWANRLARDVSEEEVGLEMLRARMGLDEVSEPFVKLFGNVLDVYKLYVEAQAGAKIEK